MKKLELSSGVWIFRILSWVCWSWIFASMFIYFLVPSWNLKTTEVLDNVFYILLAGVIIINSIIVAMIFLIRHFGLLKPVAKGTYTPKNFRGILRFFLLNLLFWIFTDIIAGTGIFLFFVSGKAWPIYFFGTFALCLMFFLTPRLKQYL